MIERETDRDIMTEKMSVRKTMTQRDSEKYRNIEKDSVSEKDRLTICLNISTGKNYWKSTY